MAYNTSKGPRQLGDIKNEDDVDTRLDWEDDYIGLKTGGTTRLAISGTAGNVGIGTVNPSHTLQIDSNSGVEGLQVNGAANQYVVSFRASTTTGQSYGPYVRAGTNGSDAALVVENAAGTTSLLKLTGEGLLGIGTTSPNRMLEVQNDDNSPQLRITHTDETHFTDFSTTSNGRLRIRPSGRTVEVDTGDTNGGNVLFTKNGGTTSGGISWDTGDQDVTLYSEADLYLGAGGSSQKVMVDNGGNVGIGTTNPTHKLTVAGAISGSGPAKFVGKTILGNVLQVSGNVLAAGHISPTVNNAKDLGASDKKWANLYVTTVTATTIAGGSPLSISASSIGFTGSMGFSGSSTTISSTGSYFSSSAGSTEISGGHIIITGSSPALTIAAGDLIVSGSSYLGDAAADITTVASQLTASEGIFINADSRKVLIGAGGDLGLQHNSNNSLIVNKTGHLRIDNQATGKHIQFDLGADDATTQVQVRNNSGNTKLYIDGTGQISGASEATFVGATVLGSSLNVSGAVKLSGVASGSAAGPSSFLAVTTAGVVVLEEPSGGGGGGISFNGSTANGLVTYGGASTADVEANLTFNGSALNVAGAMSASAGASAHSLVIQSGKSIGTNTDGNLITLTDNTVTVAGALTASTDLAGRSLIIDNGKAIGCAADTDLITLTANNVAVAGHISASARVEGHGVRIDTNGKIGTVADNDLLTLAANDLRIAGQLTASLDLKGRSLTIDDGKFIGIASDTDLLRLAANTVTANGAVKATKISSSATIESAGSVTAAGNLNITGSGIISGSLRAKQIQFTHHSYGTTATNEKWLPFQGTAVAGAPNNATEKNQMVVPFTGVLKRVIFRPSGSQGGNCIIRLYKATNGNGFVNTDEQGELVETQVVNCPASVATTSFFNFTGSSHFNAGDVVGVSVDPHANGVDFNVTCVWEFEMFGMGI
tara:strand:+ start:5361 stop:8177 length:2817 start_codon:yes stop_codon:yes gene_type:complete